MVQITIAEPAGVITDDEIADTAVAAMYAEADLTPKPGLVDRRGGGAHTDMDVAMLHRSAEALHGALTECASAARTSAINVDLRARIGAIGRAGETKMLAATGDVNTHRGALWALGWAITASIGVDVETQYTVFGSSGAVVVTALTAVLPVLLAGRAPWRAA